MNGETSDIAAGKENRAYDMRVGGHDELALRLRKTGSVVALVKEFVREVFSKEVGNKLGAGFAAGAEVHFDLSGLEIQRALIVFLFFRHFYSPEFLSFVSAVSEVSGAGAFAGYHAGADRAFRCAHRSECTTVRRLFFAAQDGAAFAGLVVGHTAVNQVEMLFSVEVAVCVGQF